MSYADIEMKVIQWGEARGIVQNGTPLGQAGKTLEEAGELVGACAKLELMKAVGYDKDSANIEVLAECKNEAIDAIGDVLVTLIMCAATLDVDVTECLALAYNEIKDRKGYLRADGVFVKESA